MDYSPRKRPEMLKIMSFDDAARVVYGGHEASKSSRDLKTVDYSPRKWPKMLEITSFDDAGRIVYRVSRGIEILPGPENGQKCSNHEV